jgi:hypothetical protein
MPSKTFSVDFETSGFSKASSEMSEVSKDADDAGDSLDDAGDSAGEAGDDMDEAGESASTMGSSMSKAGKAGAAAITAISAAVTGAVAGISTLVQQTAQYAKQVDRAAEQSGLARERIQEIAFAAQQVSGADFDAVRDGLKELAIRSEEAAMGTGEATEAFERLGISQQFLKENDTSAIFARVRQELQGASSQMRIMAAEMLLGGEAGQKMVEVLGLTNDEMQALSSRAQETGKVLSGEQVAALERTRSAWRDLTSQVVGLGRQLGAMFAPLVTQDVIPALRSMASSLRTAVESVMSMSDTTKGLVAAVTAGTAAVSAALVVYGSWPAIIGAVSTAFSGLTAAASTAYAAITSPVTAVVAAVAAVAGIAGLIYDNWSGLSSFFSQALGAVVSVATSFGDAFAQVFSTAWVEVKALFLEGLDTLIQTINNGLAAVGASDLQIDASFGVSDAALAESRSKLGTAVSDFRQAGGQAAQTFTSELSDGWDAVKQSTSDAVAFVEGQLANLGSVFSLPSMSSGGGSSDGGSQSSGEGSGEGGGSQKAMSKSLFSFIQNLEPAKKKTQQLGRVGEGASRAIASGFNRVSRSVGGAVSNLIQGKDAALDFSQTLVSTLGGVLDKLAQVVTKLLVVKGLKAALGVTSGGITSIGGVLSAAFMASGGIVTGPTLSVIGEGSEDEAVMPLSRLESMLQVPTAAAARPAAPSAGTAGLAVQVEVQGETRTEGRDLKTVYDTTAQTQTRRGR